ncbi:MAG: MurT ligase domain-containing protein [Patescibacteria group bacterium]
MRILIANLIAKIARMTSRLAKRGGGTTLPGLLAEKIAPNIITKLANQLPQGIILITGTNGKTTTARMLAAVLEANNLKVIYNSSGSNLSRGIASCLSQNSNLLGTKINGDIGIFEVDEATMPEITKKVTPKIILVTNLFRDQLDRYGELNKTASIIGSAIKRVPESIVFLNADDPLVASLKKYNKDIRYFGINDHIETKSNGAIDSKNCLECDHELRYEHRYFGHLGTYECPKCGAKKPKLDYGLSNLRLSVEKSIANYGFSDHKILLEIQLPGLYNLYNALAACAIASEMKIKDTTIQDSIKKVTAAFGRMESVEVDKKKLFLLLVKNPTGFTQVIETLSYDNKPKNLFLLLNDKFADGTDISWIWDAELELLNKLADKVVVSGIRAEDLLLRLKYADFDLGNVMIEKNVGQALDLAFANIQEGETLYVMPTYTAMLELRKILYNRSLVKGLVE